MALWKFSAREIRTRPGRAILTLISIVLGVAAVVSVSVATNTTRGAYDQLYNTMTGRADLEITATGGGRFDEKVLETVKSTPGVSDVVPMIRGIVIMYYGDSKEGKRLKAMAIGIDPTQGEGLRDYDLKEGRYFGRGRKAEVLLASAFAETLNIKIGDSVRFLTRGGHRTATVVGLLSPRGAAAVSQGGVLFMPLQYAQSLFAAKGQLDTIYVTLDKSVDVTIVLQRLMKSLPPKVTARRPLARTQMADETMRSSEKALTLSSGLSLVMAGFIILNTFLMNVSERRRHMAIMRAIGATRWQNMQILVWEALALGMVGTLLGIVVGFGGAYLLTRAMENMFQVTLPSMQVSTAAFVWAAVFGLGISLAASYFPSRKAGKVSPLEGMRPVAQRDIEGTPRWVALLGLALLAISLAILLAVAFGWLAVDVAVMATPTGLIGMVLLIPSALPPLARLLGALATPILHVEAQLARRQILRRPVRTTLTIGVLFVAVAAFIGMANSLIDNVNDVKTWHRRTIVGDFFVRAMMPDMATGSTPDIPDAIGPQIRKIPGIADIDTASFVNAQVIAKDQSAPIPALVIVKSFDMPQHLHLDLKAGDATTLLQRLQAGDVVVGTVLAQRAGLKVGDRIELETRQGRRKFPIAGISNEYVVGGLAMYMDRNSAKSLLDIQGVDVYILKAQPAAVREVEAALTKLCRENGLLLQSFADIVRIVDGMMSGVVAALGVILALGLVVAAFGIVNTLTMNVLEQTREIGLLRIVAMTRRQIRRTILAQAVMMGIIALGPGILMGLLMAYLMNLTMLQVLGRSIEFSWHPVLLACCFFGGLILVFLAAWMPAQRAAKLDLVEALRYE